jgi:hypothetical protein
MRKLEVFPAGPSRARMKMLSGFQALDIAQKETPELVLS